MLCFLQVHLPKKYLRGGVLFLLLTQTCFYQPRQLLLFSPPLPEVIRNHITKDLAYERLQGTRTIRCDGWLPVPGESQTDFLGDLLALADRKPFPPGGRITAFERKFRQLVLRGPITGPCGGYRFRRDPLVAIASSHRAPVDKRGRSNSRKRQRFFLHRSDPPNRRPDRTTSQCVPSKAQFAVLSLSITIYVRRVRNCICPKFSLWADASGLCMTRHNVFSQGGLRQTILVVAAWFNRRETPADARSPNRHPFKAMIAHTP